MHPPHLHSSFVIHNHNVQFRILSWGMILPQKYIYFKHILFIATWVWDNNIEKYEMSSWPPPPFQLIFFYIPYATFWMVPYTLSFYFLTDRIHQYFVITFGRIFLINFKLQKKNPPTSLPFIAKSKHKRHSHWQYLKQTGVFKTNRKPDTNFYPQLWSIDLHADFIAVRQKMLVYLFTYKFASLKL